QAIYTKDMLLVPVKAENMLTPQKVKPKVFTRSVPQMEDPRD
ncbi:MAG TPA: NADH-quinone oxidoreductase subunit I, partial [Anaerolineae bacterium]|nr:NADH-quinone oxidoreductase subunit I [Anaerolineae bacterium]